MSGPMDASVSRPTEGGATYPLAHRLYRLAWILTWALLASWTPPQMRGWRRLLLRIFGAKVASTAGIYGTARIWYPRNFEIGDHSFVGPDTIIYCMAPILIGDHALVSQGAHLCGGTHDFRDPHFQLIARRITIGSRAWIAAEAFVGPGVTVGEGAVLGARAVATRDLEPWTVYSGNPAVALKPRVMREAE